MPKCWDRSPLSWAELTTLSSLRFCERDLFSGTMPLTEVHNVSSLDHPMLRLKSVPSENAVVYIPFKVVGGTGRARVGTIVTRRENGVNVRTVCGWGDRVVSDFLIHDGIIPFMTRESYNRHLRMAIERGKKKVIAANGQGHARSKSFAKLYPLLHGYLTDDSFADGTSRKGATLSVFCSADGFKCCLNERDEKPPIQLWVTAESPELLFGVLESALQDEDADWREAREWDAKKSPRK